MDKKLKYERLSKELEERIAQDRKSGATNPYACPDAQAQRRDMGRDKPSLLRPAFVRDVEKILHSPYYNRYADKTQVFSFYRNDDITRRALHVQLVGRAARTIGSVLGLNLDLIEAIALGHDMGHTPFGHAGERILCELHQQQTGRIFAHNLHSVRVLDALFCRNLSLQTLSGIVSHNGELEQDAYRPRPLAGFEEFDHLLDRCETERAVMDALAPNTLEGCVVRVCDMVAYLGKDRQDAYRAHILDGKPAFTGGAIGTENAQIIHNLSVNLIENSYGKPYLCMDEAHFKALAVAKKENYDYIYRDEKLCQSFDQQVRPMFCELYERLLKDAKTMDPASILYRHHVQFVLNARKFYDKGERDYREEEPAQIVCDYLASMTDDYFIDLYHELLPAGKRDVHYISYFDETQG